MGVAAFLFALAVQATEPPPPGAEFLPPRAVDHVVTMDEQRADCANCPWHRRTITRSGSWVKDERTDSDGIETIYSDFAAGTSFTLHRDREGAPQWLVVERNYEPDGRYRVRRQVSGRRDSGAGEPCEISILTTSLVQSEMESCETADGILLWKRFLGRISPRAVLVERRPVRPEEVRPPADLFALVQWPRLDPATASASGYEVVLTSRSRGYERTTVLRKQGNFSSSRQEGRRGEGVHSGRAAARPAIPTRSTRAGVPPAWRWGFPGCAAGAAALRDGRRCRAGRPVACSASVARGRTKPASGPPTPLMSAERRTACR